MHNKRRILIFLAILASPVAGQPQEEAFSKEQIIRMIPRSHDLLNSHERENLLKLIDSVDTIYPALCDELLSTDNPRTQSYIFAILGKTQTKRDLVLPAIREFMIRHKEDDPQPDSMFTGIKTLGNIGSPEDAELLSHFLNVGFESSRVVASQAIEQIRIREKTRERESAPSKREIYKNEGIDAPGQNSKPGKTISSKTSRDNGIQAAPTYNVLRTVGLISLIGGLFLLLKFFGRNSGQR